MQVDFVRAFLTRLSSAQYQLLMPRLSSMDRLYNCWTAEDAALSPTTRSARGERGGLMLGLTGHLFDENVMGDVLNCIEKWQGSAKVLSLRLGSTTTDASEATVDVMVPEDNKTGLTRDLADMKGVTVGLK